MTKVYICFSNWGNIVDCVKLSERKAKKHQHNMMRHHADMQDQVGAPVSSVEDLENQFPYQEYEVE